jgi:hypothetical protein
MRSNVYAGVIRADLHRIGTDDYWYLENSADVGRAAVTPVEVKRRQKALVKAAIDYVASPTGAKTAGWAPHVFKTEGVILLTSARTAPFASPIKLELENAERPIQANSKYSSLLLELGNKTDTWAWPFGSVKDLLEVNKKVIGILDGKNAEDPGKDAQER